MESCQCLWSAWAQLWSCQLLQLCRRSIPSATDSSWAAWDSWRGCGWRTQVLSIQGHLWPGGLPRENTRPWSLQIPACSNVSVIGQQCARLRGSLQCGQHWRLKTLGERDGWNPKLDVGCQLRANAGYNEALFGRVGWYRIPPGTWNFKPKWGGELPNQPWCTCFCQSQEQLGALDAPASGSIIQWPSLWPAANQVWAGFPVRRFCHIDMWEPPQETLHHKQPGCRWICPGRGGNSSAGRQPEMAPTTIEEELEQEERQNMANDDGSLFILKKTPTRFQLLSNARLLFLDVCYYLPPGYSYAKYLKTYGGPSCEGAKSHFPYEYVNSLDKLSEWLPAYEAFYSSLRRKNTLDEDDGEVRGRQRYAELHALWHREGMTSLWDLLVYYNNCDVVPFLIALEKQCELYKTSGLDMLKDALSLPGLGLLFGMKGLQGVFHTLSPDQAELAQLLTTSIVGGPSLVFCRLAEDGQTTIRTPDYGTEALACQSVVGFDANSLYPFGMAKKMPVGPCLVRREPDFTVEDPVPSSSGPRHSQVALQWIDYEAKKHNYPRVQHAGSGPEVRRGQRHTPVDGYHGESVTVFQYYGCLFHGHDCRLATESGDAWLSTEASDRRQSTEEIEQYLEQTCG